MINLRSFVVLAGAVLGVLGGCAQVSGNADGVVIEHAANQVGFADLKAQRHCEAHGKRAVRVRTGPAQTSAVFLQSRISEYACVAPK